MQSSTHRSTSSLVTNVEENNKKIEAHLNEAERLQQQNKALILAAYEREIEEIKKLLIEAGVDLSAANNPTTDNGTPASSHISTIQFKGIRDLNTEIRLPAMNHSIQPSSTPNPEPTHSSNSILPLPPLVSPYTNPQSSPLNHHYRPMMSPPPSQFNMQQPRTAFPTGAPYASSPSVGSNPFFPMQTNRSLSHPTIQAPNQPQSFLFSIPPHLSHTFNDRRAAMNMPTQFGAPLDPLLQQPTTAMGTRMGGNGHTG